MPAGIPGATAVENAANPSAGTSVIFDLISGPKGAPKENDKDYPTGGNLQAGGGVANTNASTGALSTGIGFGPTVSPMGTITPNFNDDYTPGITKPDKTASSDSTLMYIGGGKSETPSKTGLNPPTLPGESRPTPYQSGFGIGAAGAGGARDAGAGPAYTGYVMKTVTAAGAVAAGGDIEGTGATGYKNRTGAALVTGQSTFGVYGTGSVAPAMAKEEEEVNKAPTKEEVAALEKEMKLAAEKEEKRIKDEEEKEKKEKKDKEDKPSSPKEEKPTTKLKG